MPKTTLYLPLVTLACCVFWVIGSFAVYSLSEAIPSFAKFTDLSLVNGRFNWLQVSLSPVLIVGGFLFCILLEILLVGFNQSSIKKLIFNPSASTKTDWFYFWLRLSGLTGFFIWIMSLGVVYYVSSHLSGMHGLRILKIENIGLQLLALVLFNTFVLYWVHRLLHSKYFWQIHKVHHAALEMTILTSSRSHPIDYMLGVFFYSIPAAVLGADPSAIMIYQVGSAIYNLMAHSNAVKSPRWTKFILLMPADHHIHHSNLPQHEDKNFGIITLWDWLFGTYHPSGKDEPIIGFTDDFNKDEYFLEIFKTCKRWLPSRHVNRRDQAV